MTTMVTRMRHKVTVHVMCIVYLLLKIVTTNFLVLRPRLINETHSLKTDSVPVCCLVRAIDECGTMAEW
jgi:hypothetical protein